MFDLVLKLNQIQKKGKSNIMQKTVCELFAGVGGFRCGLNKKYLYNEIWDTVWYNQWEPAEKKTQYAHECYQYHFGSCLDLDKNDTTNVSIELVDKTLIPDFNLLVGGFPCQDYSVASTLKTSKGIEGKKGVLWWSIRDTLEAKQPAFVLLENVDRLLKSPAKQRGRDFGIILRCFQDCGYIVEWRVINAAEYGCPQRRRRTFIFAYRSDTEYAKRLWSGTSDMHACVDQVLSESGFFAKTFAINSDLGLDIKSCVLCDTIGEVSDLFKFDFLNTGVMHDGVIYTCKTEPLYQGKHRVLGDILCQRGVNPKYFVKSDRLYYTDPSVKNSDETDGMLSKDVHKTFQYMKGGKKIIRTRPDGSEYIYSEGSMPMIDSWDSPSRTLLTSEGGGSRMTHLVHDLQTGNIRYLLPLEMERLQGFLDNHTKYGLRDGEVVEIPDNKRRFLMGNALVVDLVVKMSDTLDEIFEKEI